jgi:hypothetical protein
MKLRPNPRPMLRRFAGVGLLSAVAAFCCGAILITARPLITSIKVDGADLLIQARVPADSGTATLEAKAIDADGTWKPCATSSILHGEANFRLPKPDQNHIFRVRTGGTDASRPANTEELCFVTAKANPPAAGSECTLHFKARIDGSDRIQISRGGAMWDHVNWGFPTSPVSINGVEWNPQEKNLFAPPGSLPLIPGPFDLRSARLEIIEGRDTVVCEPSADGVTVYVNDTPSGPAPYEFKVHFSAGATPAPRPTGKSATLTLIANIDGSDRVVITSAGANWEHKCWGWPSGVLLNGIAWSPQEHPTLSNEGDQLLPAGVDFASARVVSRSGRDLAVLETREDAVIIHFADNPNGHGRYEVRLAFGK